MMKPHFASNACWKSRLMTQKPRTCHRVAEFHDGSLPDAPSQGLKMLDVPKLPILLVMIITIDKIRNWLWNLFWVGKTHRHVPIRKKNASMFSRNFQVFPDSHLSRISPGNRELGNRDGSSSPWGSWDFGTRPRVPKRKMWMWTLPVTSDFPAMFDDTEIFQAIQSNSGFQGISMVNWRGGPVAFFGNLSPWWRISHLLVGGFNPSDKYESQLGWWHSQ